MMKDDAMQIAHAAQEGRLTLEELLDAYGKFHAIVNNTATSVTITTKIGELKNEEIDELLHGAMGLVTESAEIIDQLKKNFYGKQRPYSMRNFQEELGDIFYYFTTIQRVLGVRFRDIIAENMIKLANRYIENFDEYKGKM